MHEFNYFKLCLLNLTKILISTHLIQIREVLINIKNLKIQEWHKIKMSGSHHSEVSEHFSMSHDSGSFGDDEVT